MDAFWAAAHPGMSKDERKEACLVVVEQYEASLIDLMTTTALFGRVDIVIDVDVGIGENKHDTPALASRQHVHTHANTRKYSGAHLPTLIRLSYSLHSTKRTPSFVGFRSVFSLVLPRNQIAKNSSLFLVYSKVYSCMICL